LLRIVISFFRGWLAAGVNGLFETVAGEASAHFADIGFADLHDRTQLFAEKLRERIPRGGREGDVETGATSKRHFEQRDEKPAVGSVVVGKNFSVAHKFLNRGEKAHKARRIVKIGRNLADLAKDLRQGRPAQSILARAQIDQQKFGLADGTVRSSGVRARRMSVAGAKALTMRESGAVTRFSCPPSCQTVLMDMESLPTWDGDAKGRRKLFADSADGFEEAHVLAGVTGWRHPVRRELDVANGRRWGCWRCW
jgi:hypothetical protein